MNLKKELVLLFTMATVSAVSCCCPLDKMHKIGACAFQIHCRNVIRGVSLPDECQGSSNYPVNVELTLTDASETFDHSADIELLTAITSLKISGDWHSTNLSALENMPGLQKLYLARNNIQDIAGAPFYHLNNLEIVDLSGNRLNHIGEELFAFENIPNKMRKLSLAHNEIEEIHGDAFVELSSLTELDLSHNYISDLTEEPFNNLTLLQTLKLNNNKIKDLNGALNNLQNLKHLYLSGNNLHNIHPPSLKIIYDLKTLDISSNQLEHLTHVVFSRHWNQFENSSVCKINLSGNHLTFLPNATSVKAMFERYTLKRKFDIINVMTELDLSNNRISTIEYDAFQTIVRLTILDLSQNKLTNLLVNPRDLEHIKYLNLSTNFIQTLNFESFWSMSNLQNLDLSYNALENIPDQTFINNFNLKYLNMTFNEIKVLDDLRIKIFHPQGGVLDLSNNGLYRLNIPSGEGLHLNMLLLNSNNISDASLINLCFQNELKSLDMSRNLIQRLDENSLRLPITLSFLDLSNNYIEKIAPSSFHAVSHLVNLKLSHNKIQELEYGSFQGLSSLQYLDLSYNEIRYLDSKMLMELKSLSILSLKFNGLYMLEYKGWLHHKFNLKVYLEGNEFTCDWLGSALNDYNNGYSKMRPAVLVKAMTGHSLEGIPCISNQAGNQMERMTSDPTVMVDERLLVLTQKILDAVRDQNSFMRKYLWGSQQEEMERIKRKT